MAALEDDFGLETAAELAAAFEPPPAEPAPPPAPEPEPSPASVEEPTVPSDPGPHLRAPDPALEVAPPQVGRGALEEALGRAGVCFPIERERLLTLVRGVTAQYRPGEHVELSQLLGLSQNPRFYSMDELHAFVQQFLTPPGWRPGHAAKPVFAEHYGRKHA